MPGGRISRRAMLAHSVGAAAGVAIARPLERLFAAEAAENLDREIWDGHVHLTGLNGPVETRVDELLRCADRVGITRLPTGKS